MHLDFDLAIAFTSLAATALDIKAKLSGLIAVSLPRVMAKTLRISSNNLVYVAGCWGAANRLLIDGDHGVEVL